MTGPASRFEAEGIPDPGDLEPEQHEGESLDGRLAREVPDGAAVPALDGRPAEEAAMHVEPED